ncbi:MAG: bifunctional DNA primase/polymerase [Dehalococcoidia bacterium]
MESGEFSAFNNHGLPSISQIRRTALAAYDAGLCPVPVRQDGSKAPLGNWGKYQRERPSRQQVADWYGPRTGLGLVCGPISGNLECLEFDDPSTYDAYKELAAASGLGGLVERLESAYLERSPSGGIHWLYRCSEISGNTKLAGKRDGSGRVKVLIETRGQGGYIIIAPSHGGVHPSGQPYRLLRGAVESIPTISPDEHRALWELAQSFDLLPKPPARESEAAPDTFPGDRPGDAFNARGSWSSILEPQGWQLIYQRDGVGYWRRPGKDYGISATTNWNGSGLLYAFTTSTLFESQKGYTKFAAYALLFFYGDCATAARSLARLGYRPADRLPRRKHRPRRITSWEVRG